MDNTNRSSSTLHHDGDFVGPMYLQAHTNEQLTGEPARIVVTEDTIATAMKAPERYGFRSELVAVAGLDSQLYDRHAVSFDASGFPVPDPENDAPFVTVTVYVAAQDLADYLVFARAKEILYLTETLRCKDSSIDDYVARLDSVIEQLRSLKGD